VTIFGIEGYNVLPTTINKQLTTEIACHPEQRFLESKDIMFYQQPSTNNQQQKSFYDFSISGEGFRHLFPSTKIFYLFALNPL